MVLGALCILKAGRILNAAPLPCFTGRTAQACLLTRIALRIYGELGLLVPDRVDPPTQYRCYHPRQLKRARLIRLLREMEMPLAEIKRVLEAGSMKTALEIVQLRRAHCKLNGQKQSRGQPEESPHT